jgi:hypothetical protein
MTVENRGSLRCHLQPRLDFSLFMDRVKFSSAQVIHLANQMADDVDIEAGEAVSGALAFEVRWSRRWKACSRRELIY